MNFIDVWDRKKLVKNSLFFAQIFRDLRQKTTVTNIVFFYTNLQKFECRENVSLVHVGIKCTSFIIFQFGRKKKKYRSTSSPPTGSKSPQQEKKVDNEGDEDDDEDDDEDGDISKYMLDDSDDEEVQYRTFVHMTCTLHKGNCLGLSTTICGIDLKSAECDFVKKSC